MTNFSKNPNNEIDLLDMLKLFWQGKWLIILCILIALFCGGALLFNQKTKHRSKIFFTIQTLPPFYDNETIYFDFKNKFFAKEVFSNWKNSNNKISLKLSDLIGYKRIDGYMISENPNEQFISIINKNKNGFLLTIGTNNLKVLSEIFLYSKHINSIMSEQYLQRAKNELMILEKRINNFNVAYDTVFLKLLDYDRYIDNVRNGAILIEIKRPTSPESLSPKSSLILVISALLGGIIGVLFIFILRLVDYLKQNIHKLQ